MYLAITGRQSNLALAELESLFDSSLITPFGDNAALIDDARAPQLFAQIGSSIKLAQVFDVTSESQFNPSSWVNQHFMDAVELTDNRKLNLGVSCYQADQHYKPLLSALSSKLQEAGKKVRQVPPKHKNRLSSAQVFHNKLDMPRNIELVCVSNGDKIALAQTVAIQNITAYRVRDRDRPGRDAVVGMLPPKLAQTLINLSGVSAKATGLTLLDPFCGTGVTLMEAGLMGFTPYGTDISKRMVKYS